MTLMRSASGNARFCARRANAHLRRTLTEASRRREHGREAVKWARLAGQFAVLAGGAA